ncbi:MAG TPA: hypothetical protein PLA03_13825, partial [Acidobacteriota bacterium]|nr:hypothetical protein [Acidobacteriota bacterium]
MEKEITITVAASFFNIFQPPGGKRSKHPKLLIDTRCNLFSLILYVKAIKKGAGLPAPSNSAKLTSYQEHPPVWFTCLVPQVAVPAGPSPA